MAATCRTAHTLCQNDCGHLNGTVEAVPDTNQGQVKRNRYRMWRGRVRRGGYCGDKAIPVWVLT